jgi:hypothetical protein
MKKFLLVLLVLLLIAAAVGYFLPSGYTVEKSVVINAKPSKIHELVGDLKRWDEWTPWKEMDPTVQVTFGKETKGVGASQTWTSDEGVGFLTFTASDEDRGIAYDMKLDEWKSKGEIRYDRMGDGTNVTWGMTGDVDMPVVGGYFALLMPRMIGPAFEKGLGKLKTVAEK